MESKLLTEIEWEARRVAAAFGVEVLKVKNTWSGREYLAQLPDGTRVAWYLDCQKEYWAPEGISGIAVGSSQWNSCEVECERVHSDGKTEWNWSPQLQFNEIMVKGLFRLGFDEAELFSELNHPLTDDEKLELRLSLPREFWPPKWLDEEKE